MPGAGARQRALRQRLPSPAGAPGRAAALSSPPLPASAVAALHITDIESAINWWREKKPSPDGITACAEVLALAEVYALMVYYHEAECDEASMPAAAHGRLARLVRDHARRALHRHLLHQPGRRDLQGLRPQLRGGAALDLDVAGREARHLAPHHPGRHGLALQSLRRAWPVRARLKPAGAAEPVARAAS